MVGGGDTGITAGERQRLRGQRDRRLPRGHRVLALVALPYAAGDRPLGRRPLASFPILTVAGWIGLGLSVIQLVIAGAFSFSQPAQVFTNGPGLWLAALGLIVLSRATYDMAREPACR